MAQYRRSIFIINKAFQFRFALYVCSWLIALSFVYPLIVNSLFDYFVRYATLDPNGPPVQALLDTRQSVLTLLLVLQGLFLFVTFLISLFMSHRIAGPLYKLSKFFEIARDGNLKEELYFRDKDHFQDIAMQYNEMIRAVRLRQEAASSELETVLPLLSAEARPAVEKALASLRTVQ
jgi:sensor histidine kinase YesM